MYYVKNTRTGQYLKRNEGNRNAPVCWVRTKEESSFAERYVEAGDLRLRLPLTVQNAGNAIIVDETDMEVTPEMAQARGDFHSRSAQPN